MYGDKEMKVLRPHHVGDIETTESGILVWRRNAGRPSTCIASVNFDADPHTLASHADVVRYMAQTHFDLPGARWLKHSTSAVITSDLIKAWGFRRISNASSEVDQYHVFCDPEATVF